MQRQREKQTPCGEPDVGPDPRNQGSLFEPKAGVQPLSHPGVPPPNFHRIGGGSLSLRQMALINFCKSYILYRSYIFKELENTKDHLCF